MPNNLVSLLIKLNTSSVLVVLVLSIFSVEPLPNSQSVSLDLYSEKSSQLFYLVSKGLVASLESKGLVARLRKLKGGRGEMSLHSHSLLNTSVFRVVQLTSFMSSVQRFSGFHTFHIIYLQFFAMAGEAWQLGCVEWGWGSLECHYLNRIESVAPLLSLPPPFYIFWRHLCPTNSESLWDSSI